MNSRTLQGWQFNDSSRSSWDIVWTCLTTIFACTWTILHLGVPARNKSQALIIAAKLWVFTFNFLAPETIGLTAPEELWRVRSLRERWGLILEAEDEWIYYVLRDQICALIEAGVIKCYTFTNSEIPDRAKADEFAKFFTVCQSLWVTVNIVGRAGYDLPITLFEFSALASYWGFALRDGTIVNMAATFHGLIFCDGTTHAEKIAWLVFSPMALEMLVAYYLDAQAPLVARWLKNKGVALPAFLDNYADPHGTFTKTEIFLPLWVILFYILARFGIVVLIFSSIRAHPSEAYIAVDWLASIPHI
ncbi:hypothetical protein BJX68DRAFT_266624 [Aspergillus pseudodeflectus]|uniref:Uncharacterized protein n=1 Tax=Aspergillus pseudodeflectus TaxID=176178 RepID=A0ABR4KDR7_9EURO